MPKIRAFQPGERSCVESGALFPRHNFSPFMVVSYVIESRPMSDSNTPQFSTAEYAGQPAGDRCGFCQQSITSRYYRVNNAMVCPACTEKAALEAPQDNHAAFMRALLFGAGAAIAGLVLYAAVEIATGWIIGYVSLAVGWMVGKAMMAGSKGIGGRRYQIAAILLTYGAVSMAVIPVIISQGIGRRGASQRTETRPASSDQGDSAQPNQSQAKPRVNLLGAVGQLAFLGLASPFLELQDPFHGLLGLFILSIGIRIAWQITAGTRTSGILGPFSYSPPAAT